ncbi:hypothetical protein ATG66_1079 [Vibrio sp. ES.051]|nr:hypothetical protein ATG66_1079 [Vibrio sp. ES.051]
MPNLGRFHPFKLKSNPLFLGSVRQKSGGNGSLPYEVSEPHPEVLSTQAQPSLIFISPLSTDSDDLRLSGAINRQTFFVVTTSFFRFHLIRKKPKVRTSGEVVVQPHF